MSRRSWWAIVAAICTITCARIAATWSVFAPTCDEPAHIAAGYEYLTQHKYTIDSEHPPLARAIFALPLMRRRVPEFDAYAHGGDANQLHLGDAVLGERGEMMRNIVLARSGNLVFVVIAIVATALQGADLFGAIAGLIAAALLALAPPFLAHGGLATTDMAGTAAFALALFVLRRWLGLTPHPPFGHLLPARAGRRPTAGFPSPRDSGERVARERRVRGGPTIAFGLAIAFGALCKFSFLVFFGVCAVIAVIAARKLPVVKLAGALAIAFVLIWGGYLFHHARMAKMNPAYRGHVLANINLPAPQFVFGLIRVKEHDARGTPAFLLGRVSQRGFWYYFPVVFAVKTPIPLLLLGVAGAFLVVRRRMHVELLAMAVALMLVVMGSHINLGVRHILPEYVLLALLAAYATVTWWRPAAVLVAWLAIAGVVAHPDYLPWMNLFAGSHPERVVVESNFDWGQDVTRLAAECQRRGITSLGWAVFSTIDPTRVGVPPVHAPSSGWTATSETVVQTLRTDAPPNFIRVGKTIRLYRVE